MAESELVATFQRLYCEAKGRAEAAERLNGELVEALREVSEQFQLAQTFGQEIALAKAEAAIKSATPKEEING